MTTTDLRRLFEACDRNRQGSIGGQEFRELCTSFDISERDADVIFADLDRDHDHRISFDDFALGFRDFLSPSAADSSVTHQQANDFSNGSSSATGTRRRRLERKSTEKAWKQLTERFGEDQIRRSLGNRRVCIY